MSNINELNILIEGLREIQKLGGPAALLATSTLARASEPASEDAWRMGDRKMANDWLERYTSERAGNGQVPAVTVDRLVQLIWDVREGALGK